MREFGISQQLASADIATFLASEAPRVRYDVSAKTYVLEDDLEAEQKGGA
ncbi:hypothetical protein BDIM_05970 [Brevundimonas diminuta ATCC 11568]|nr:hypothetical protein BDIM_05970 [Brevundimonas diminuta ATCC 11568]